MTDHQAQPSPSMLDRVLTFALTIDREQARADVASLRSQHPAESAEALARRLLRRAKWKGTAIGAASGLPANPWVALPAAALEAGSVLRLQIEVAARIALVHEPDYLDDDEPPYELLVPILGSRAFAELGRTAAIRGGMGLTRAAIRKYVAKGTLKRVKQLALRYLGIKVTQRALITKTLPVVGAVIGGVWNHAEIGIVGRRVSDYFAGRAISE